MIIMIMAYDNDYDNDHDNNNANDDISFVAGEQMKMKMRRHNHFCESYITFLLFVFNCLWFKLLRVILDLIWFLRLSYTC